MIVLNSHAKCSSEAVERGRSPQVLRVAPGRRLDYQRNEEIFGEGEPARFIYRVISGAVRVFRVSADGKRRIAGFYFRGEVFGLHLGETHAYSAEAIDKASLLASPKPSLLEAALEDCGAARELIEMLDHARIEAEAHAAILAHGGAEERVASFLLRVSERLGACLIDLPMSRADIADYLGLTIETVSRTVTQLERNGVINLFSARRVELRRPDELARLEAA